MNFRLISIAVCTLMLIGCSNQSENPQKETVAVPADFKVYDFGNEGGYTDIYFVFSKSAVESNVLEYRIVLVPSNRSVEEADLLAGNWYFTIDKTGFDHHGPMSQETKDFFGDKISMGGSYKAYLIVVSNSELKSDAISDPVDITLEDEPYYDVRTLGNINQTEALTYDPVSNSLLTPGFRIGKLSRMNIETGRTEIVSANLDGPLGGTFDLEGEFFYLSIWNKNHVVRYDGNGNHSVFVTGIPEPTGLTFDRMGNLYVSSYSSGTIYKVDSQGVKSVYSKSALFTSLDGLVFSGSTLYAANFLDPNILKIEPDGEVSLFATLPTAETAYTGYIAKVGGKLFVPSGVQIFQIDFDGDVSLVAGSTKGHFDGPALASQFSGPNGITSTQSGDTIFVGDQTKIRMLIKRE